MNELYFQLLFGAWTAFVLIIGVLLGAWHERAN